MQQMEAAGKTAVLVSVDGMVRLVIGISDALKPESAQTVRALHDAQMQVKKVLIEYMSLVATAFISSVAS